MPRFEERIGAAGVILEHDFALRLGHVNPSCAGVEIQYSLAVS